MAGMRARRHGGAWREGIVAAFLMLPAAATAVLDEAAVSEQVVTIRVYKDDRLAAEGAGVVVNEQGDVLTSAAVLDAGPRASVVTLDSTELIAQRTWKGKDWGLALLRVEGLAGPGLPLSTAEVLRGAAVFAVTPAPGSGSAEFSPGAVAGLTTHSFGADEPGYVQHVAAITRSGYGSPVVNECGEVIGINVPAPDAFSFFGVPRNIKPRETVYALGVGELVTRLRAEDIEFVTVADACKTAAERAEEERKKAEEAATEEKQRAEEAQKQAEEAQKQAEEAQKQAEEARKQAEDEKKAREAAERRRQEAQEKAEQELRDKEEAARIAEEERKRRERLKRLALWGGAGAATLLLLLVLFWGLSAQRKRRALRSAQGRAESAEQEARRARRQVADLPEPAPFDCVLTGEDDSGTPYALNLRRDTLGRPEGVVVGRDPAKSSHVVTESSVSRAHVRVYVSSGNLHVEDVGSTNGTYLNGKMLEVGEGVQVNDGDELALGSITMRVELRH